MCHSKIIKFTKQYLQLSRLDSNLHYVQMSVTFRTIRVSLGVVPIEMEGMISLVYC